MTDDEMIKQYGFNPNDREIIEAGFANPDSNNPIIKAYVKRIETLTKILCDVAETTGKFPDNVELPEPETLFDKMVVDMFQYAFEGSKDAPRVETVNKERQ